ncbi:MAG: hypothetical protein IPG47_04380 [Thermoflexaceae bacterium]|nr:hypothetical protein [Thermoflexaceae bacterium]
MPDVTVLGGFDIDGDVAGFEAEDEVSGGDVLAVLAVPADEGTFAAAEAKHRDQQIVRHDILPGGCWAHPSSLMERQTNGCGGVSS